jgi:aspartyl-tRNA(Asn)/glutamyl-tRNA(Gln) amidotransferase subunit A
MSELCFLTASELAPLIESKQLSPVELVKELLDRIERLDPTYNSYITTLPQYTMRQAELAEKDIMKNSYKGPLHGIPVGIKDLFYTKGIRTTSGSGMLKKFVPEYNATTVEKLLNAGAIMTGKLNTHEFAGGLTNINPFYGSSRNPWNPNYITGGSSGGSGAALTAGLATIATGSDTFGSIQIPSAMCGVYGLKPTYGLISTHGITPLAVSLDHPGPMARSVADLALMLNVMAGHDGKDSTTVRVKIPDYTEGLNKGIKGLKIGIPRYFLEGLAHDVEALFKKAVISLTSMGAQVTEVNIPELQMSTYIGYVVMTSEASNFHYEMLQSNQEGYGPDVRILFESGVLIDTVQYLRAQQARRKIVDALKKAFEKFDVLAGPAMPITVPRFRDDWVDQNLELIRCCMPFTAPANVSGTPRLTVPIGLSSDGMPVGMQLIGNHLCEGTLLQLGSAWETAYKSGKSFVGKPRL